MSLSSSGKRAKGIINLWKMRLWLSLRRGNQGLLELTKSNKSHALQCTKWDAEIQVFSSVPCTSDVGAKNLSESAAFRLTLSLTLLIRKVNELQQLQSWYPLMAQPLLQSRWAAAAEHSLRQLQCAPASQASRCREVPVTTSVEPWFGIHNHDHLILRLVRRDSGLRVYH